jgi:predicted outer membrane repeat protein
MKAYNACPIRFIRLLRLLCPILILILMVFTSSTVLPGAGLLPVVTTGSGPSTQLSNILFVVPSGAASGECASWGTGCDLQYALTKAAAPAKLWVKMGIYHPTIGTDQNASFQLKNGVAIYGGFLGTETALDQREPGVNRTTLSGEIGSATTFDNSYHVVIVSGTDTSAVLDGVTINAGNATGAAPNSRAGGGMVIAKGSPTLSNVTFSNNSASNNGGGLYCSVGSPELNSVTFIGNNAGSSGGGMFIISGSPVLKNVTFSGNTAVYYGGGLTSSSSSPALSNVTLSGNTADQGGGIYNQNLSNLVIGNSLLWGNTPDQIYNEGDSSITVSYSDV